MSILEWLGLAGTPEDSASQSDTASPQTETVRRIVEALDDLAPEQARYIASFAYILGRVAHADLDISEEETREMERAVIEHAGLPEEQVLIVVHMAKTHNQLFGGTENFLVTREFDQNATREQKLALIDCLFAVSASDQSISSEEDVEIRKIADELHLTRQDFVSARSRYREHLEVLKQRKRE